MVAQTPIVWANANFFLGVQTNLLFNSWKGVNIDEFKQLHLKNGTM